MAMNNRTKRLLYDLLARVVAVAPPAAITLYHVPLFVSRSSEATLSGLSLFALFICMIPFWRKLKDIKKFLFNASTPVLWIIVVGVFYFLSKIADEVIVIGVAGCVGACASAWISHVGKKKYGEEIGGDRS